MVVIETPRFNSGCFAQNSAYGTAKQKYPRETGGIFASDKSRRMHLKGRDFYAHLAFAVGLL